MAMQWLWRQLPAVDGRDVRPLVVLDPDGLADSSVRVQLAAQADVPWAQMWEAHNYVELRAAWEAHGRHPDGGRPVFWVQSAEFSRGLPWDIERSSQVVRLSWPVPPRWQAAARELPREVWDVLAEAAADGGASEEAVLGQFLMRAYDAPLPQGNLGRELVSIIRLHRAGVTARGIWEGVRPWLRGPLAAELASAAPRWEVLQVAWDEWIANGAAAPHAATFEAAGPELTALFSAGVLRRAAGEAADLPAWAKLGTSPPSAADHAAALLKSPPTADVPTTAEEWLETAAWWGEVRSALARGGVSGPLAAGATAVWTSMDAAFSTWIRARYGLLFSVAADYPLTLDRVAAFLAKRLRQTGNKQLLVVMDGMGWAQWAEIRRGANLTVAESTGCFAMIPTVTSVSRQAIFAGAPPWAFPHSLLSTSQEARHWRRFWHGEGLPASDVAFYHTAGATAADVPALGQEQVAAVVVMAVDDLVHSAHVLGDEGVALSLAQWLAHEMLRQLVAQAAALGYDIWLTADHGNLEMEPGGRVSEGSPLSESTSTRVRLYESAILRKTANAAGIAWDPPSLPPGHYPLFAPGKLGYFDRGRQVSHGGLSLDEVIVPLVRVTP